MRHALATVLVYCSYFFLRASREFMDVRRLPAVKNKNLSGAGPPVVVR